MNMDFRKWKTRKLFTAGLHEDLRPENCSQQLCAAIAATKLQPQNFLPPALHAEINRKGCRLPSGFQTQITSNSPSEKNRNLRAVSNIENCSTIFLTIYRVCVVFNKKPLNAQTTQWVPYVTFTLRSQVSILGISGCASNILAMLHVAGDNYVIQRKILHAE